MNAMYRVSSENNVTLKSGILAGVIGGVVMALAFMAYSSAIGQGFWTPVEAIGATFYGTDAFLGGVGPILTGLAIHMLVSAGLGVIFSYSLSNTTSNGGAAALGVCFGVAVWAVMTFVVLNLVNQPMRMMTADIAGAWFSLHLLFGACLGSVPSLRRVFARGYLDPRSSAYLDRAA